VHKTSALNFEIINTGSELLLGRVLNSHQQWLCNELVKLGFEVFRQVAVSDSSRDIEQSVREALCRADCIITTGGLGPTSDDLTRECIARLLNKRLLPDETTLANLERFYFERKRPVLESTKVQAMVPENSIVLHNANGTAPGLAMEISPNPFRPDGKPSFLIMLPGPPRELYPMFSNQVIPLLTSRFPQVQPVVYRSFRTTGYGESQLEEKIGNQLKPLMDNGLVLSYCARIGDVEIRIGARDEQAASLLDPAEKIIRDHIGDSIYGMNNDLLETVIIRGLAQRKQTLAVAESCTGGLISHRLTNVPGASEVFMAGLITYSNEAKHRLLGVPMEVIQAEGAVSEATARAMAEGARIRNSVDYALSVSGIAGPGGGSEKKPVGTVFIGLATPKTTVVRHYLNRFDRETFKNATAQQAMDLLRKNWA
jgi:nicotinamide-nucleotide amidase